MQSHIRKVHACLAVTQVSVSVHREERECVCGGGGGGGGGGGSGGGGGVRSDILGKGNIQVC